MKPRKLKYSEYLEVTNMRDRLNEMYSETKDDQIAALCDAMSDAVYELEQIHDAPMEEALADEEFEHQRIEKGMVQRV